MCQTFNRIKFTVVIFSRQDYDLYTIDVMAKSAEAAIDAGQTAYIKVMKSDMDISMSDARANWDEGEYSCIYAFESDCDSAMGSLP